MKRNSSKGKQSRKDSQSKRVNYDNTRVKKFEKDQAKSEARENFAPRTQGRGKMIWIDSTPNCKSTDNDFSWYNRNPELIDSAARIGFSRTTGMPDGNNIIAPGVMTLFWESAAEIGVNTAITQAANSLYSNVVHANSRNTSYTSQDLMMMLLAAREVFAGLAIGIRAFGLMLEHNQENFYCPEALITASGFNYDDLKANYSHMQYDMNQLIADAKQIWVPRDLPVFHRAFWLGTNVYTDSESVKGQYFLFVPAILKFFDATGNKQGGQVICYPDTSDSTAWKKANFWQPLKGSLPINGATWSQYINAMNKLISALIRNEYRGVIMGDILKAYGAENLFSINFVSNDYRVQPVYNREVMMQIENATFTDTHGALGIDLGITGTNFIQDQYTESIMGQYAFVTQSAYPSGLEQASSYLYPTSPVLNFHFKGQPTVQEVTIATRFTSVGNIGAFGPNVNNPSEFYGVWPRSVGTERLVACIIVRNSRILAGDQATQYEFTYVTQNLETDNPDTNLHALALHSTFDWAPMLYLAEFTVPTGTQYKQVGTLTVADYIGDLDNYIVLQNTEIQRLHDACVMSLFGVPVLR